MTLNMDKIDNSTQQESFDICIVGAGMAGATIASYLAPKGIKIALFDRDFSKKDRIVGELLQPGAVETLRKMDLEYLLEGFDSQPVYGYALFQNDKKFTIAYNKSSDTQYHGTGLHNGRFLQTIRNNALESDNVTQFNGTVTDLIEDENQVVTGIQYREKQTREIKSVSAKLTIMSDGFFSSFRKDLSNNVKQVTSFFIGLVLKDCLLPYPNHGHVFLSAPTPFICYPISSTETRLLIDFPGTKAPKRDEIKEYITTQILPFIPDEFLDSVISSIETSDFKVMPNHFMPAKPILKKGAVLLGDALNMRHPITGGGLTAVFSDVYLLSSHLLSMPSFDDPDLLHKKIALYYQDRFHANTNVNIMANSLYGVMSNDNLKVAVFDYLAKGGDSSNGPISLLSGLNRNPAVLMKHFIYVALLCIANLFKGEGRSVSKAFRVVKDTFCIIWPLAVSEIRFSSFCKKNREH